MAYPPQPGSDDFMAPPATAQPGTAEALAASAIALRSAASGIPAPGLPLPSARTVAILAAAYRLRQIALARQAERTAGQLWAGTVNPDHFSDSWKTMRPLLMGVVDSHFRASAADAASYYQTSRISAGFGHMPVPGVQLDQEYLSRVLGNMGPGMFYHMLKNEDPLVASQSASSALQGAVTRLVLRGSRETVATAARADKDALGWERVISPGACSFCAMLASRGGVYKATTAGFRAHDHCSCTAHVVFRGFSPEGDRLSGEWQRVTKGKSGAAARAAWDEYWRSINEHSIAAGAEEPAIQGPGNAAQPAERQQ